MREARAAGICRPELADATTLKLFPQRHSAPARRIFSVRAKAKFSS